MSLFPIFQYLVFFADNFFFFFSDSGLFFLFLLTAFWCVHVWNCSLHFFLFEIQVLYSFLKKIYPNNIPGALSIQLPEFLIQLIYIYLISFLF